MQVTISIDGTDSAEELRSVYTWLSREDDLRGHLRPVQRPPEPGTLGSVLQTLIVTLGPGSAAATASAIVTWLRYRTNDIVVRIAREDGTSIELAAKRVRGSDPAATAEVVASLSRTLGSHENAPPSSNE
jgi:hypothetical protein